MLDLYKYLYYRLYSWNLNTWGENDLPQWNALFGVSFMMFINIGIVAGIIDIFGLNIFIEDTPKIEILVFGFLILFINYFWLVHNGKYKKIAKLYNKESKNIRLRNTILLWLYVLVSFVIISFVAILSGKINGLQ
jgi:hypothetical protein